MDPTQAATTAVLTPWQNLGIIGSVVIALGVTVVYLLRWLRAVVEGRITRLETELEAKEQAYERLVDNIRKRTKEETP